jgi:glutamine amidotransferase
MAEQPNIVIVDYGIGNTHSVSNAIKYLGYKNIIISDNENIIQKADALILPGVGAFEECINNLKNRKLDIILNEAVIVNKKPILGICVGMQLLATCSEEMGLHNGLNWIEGRVKKLNPQKPMVIPHVGWNDVISTDDNVFFRRNAQNTNFYFDHSYYFACEDKYVLSYCDYGIKVTAAVQKDNIYGVQFHPEKSQTNGLKLFRSFFNSI